MVEVSEIGLKEEEVELDLGLSIGGSFRKSEKQREPASKSNGFELHLEEHQHQHQALPGLRDEKPESMAVMDLQTKREIHALRRQEAKKKREEKQHKRVTGTCRGRAGDCVGESEPEHQRVSKRGKTDHHDGGSECPNVNLNLSNGEKGLSRTAVGSTASFPTTPVQQPHPYAYVPLNNGFAYPCVLPWLAPCGKEKNVAQPAGVCNGFRPFSANGYASEQNGERDCGDKKAKSNGSSMCSSSAVSDYQSSSHEGGGSSDSHSHSVHSLAEPTQLNSSKETNIRSQPEQTASSHPLRSEHGNVGRTNDQTKLKEEPTIDYSKAVPRDKPLCNTNSANGPLKETKKKDIGKPPKPLLPQTSSHAQMPYVSTTGNGPNGKTVYGFLYRYTNSEVSIVCVCHGSTFSPAEFVHHAGGTDISHPLRHITVSQVSCRRI